MRPVLSPAARRLWRDPETLQLGQSPERAAVLCGLDERTRAALALLDGTRDRDQVLVAAALAGCPPERTALLLDLLDDAGLLEDAGTSLGPLSLLSRLERERLAAAGVGSVDVLDDGATAPADSGLGAADLDDVGRSRGQAARERLRAGAPSLVPGPLPHPDLVVLAPARSELLDDARALVPAGTPHLLAEVRDTTGIVGPLVLPGRTACLRCLDLTRTDLDPDWPALSAQLAVPSRVRPACDAPLAVMVAAQAAMQVLALVDGTVDPAAAGGTLELALPDWRWRRRSWRLHPQCGCALPWTG